MVKISKEEYEKIKEIRAQNKNKRIEKLLEVLCLRYEQKSNAEIAHKTGYNPKYIADIISKYNKVGLEEFLRNKYTSHNRKMSVEREIEVMERINTESEEGHLISVGDIRKAVEAELGEEAKGNYVYRLLHRHGWRKVAPRPKHPKAATKEEQDSSKKSKLSTMN